MEAKEREWLKAYCEILELNAMIQLRSMENKRNFLQDEYYKNYDRFTPVSLHRTDHIDTLPKYLAITGNELNIK